MEDVASPACIPEQPQEAGFRLQLLLPSTEVGSLGPHRPIRSHTCDGFARLWHLLDPRRHSNLLLLVYQILEKRSVAEIPWVDPQDTLRYNKSNFSWVLPQTFRRNVKFDMSQCNNLKHKICPNFRVEAVLKWHRKSIGTIRRYALKKGVIGTFRRYCFGQQGSLVSRPREEKTGVSIA